MLLNEQKCQKCGKEVGIGDSSWCDQCEKLLCTDCDCGHYTESEPNPEQDFLDAKAEEIENYLTRAQDILAPIYKDFKLSMVDECIDEALEALKKLKEELAQRQKASASA